MLFPVIRKFFLHAGLPDGLLVPNLAQPGRIPSVPALSRMDLTIVWYLFTARRETRKKTSGPTTKRDLTRKYGTTGVMERLTLLRIMFLIRSNTRTEVLSFMEMHQTIRHGTSC